MLVCRDGSLYTGMTNDLRRRMALHTGGKGAKYTRTHPPAALAGCDYAPVRGMTLERLLEEGYNG